MDCDKHNISGRGAKAAYQNSLLETAVQFRSPDPISLIVKNWPLAGGVGVNCKKRKNGLLNLTSQLCIPGLRRLRWLLRLSVRRSSRSSSGRAGLRNSCVPQASRVAIGLSAIVGGVSCGASPIFAFIPEVPGVYFGKEIPQPSFLWWYAHLSVEVAIVIIFFWVMWVCTGDHKD